MEEIITRRAKKSEIDWINSSYAEVNFVPSNFDKEFIVVAEQNNQKCGLGRVVRIDNFNLELGGIYVFQSHRGKGVAQHIVRFLCDENTFEQSRIWCLPFDNLSSFYKKFDFKETSVIDHEIPIEIIEKYNWCNNNYEKPVLLLLKNQ